MTRADALSPVDLEVLERIRSDPAKRAAVNRLAAAAAKASVRVRPLITPQPGPQADALKSKADVVIMGGAAFGGKTVALLLDGLKGADKPGYRGMVFRRTVPLITMAGGLWDTSHKIYGTGGEPVKSPVHTWRFPSGGELALHHLQYLETAEAMSRGARSPWIGFDQLEEFEEAQFWHLFGRSLGRVFATCNPVPDDDPVGGWLAALLRWWWDPETGYAIQERAGAVRWFYRRDREILWYNSRDEAMEANPDLASDNGHPVAPTSLAFFPAGIDDNPAGEADEPLYRARLHALDEIERERRLRGNWKIRDARGGLYEHRFFEGRFLDALREDDVVCRVRFADKAGTALKPSEVARRGAPKSSKTCTVRAARVRMGEGLPDRYVIEDATGAHLEMAERETHLRALAEADGAGVRVRLEQEPGSGGKDSARLTVGFLAGFDAEAVRPTSSKLERGKPALSQAKAGNVWLMRGAWNTAFLRALTAWDGGRSGSDEADAWHGAFAELARPGEFAVPAFV